MTDKAEPMEDILDALYRLRVAFKKHGMEAPISIELGSHRDKDTFRHSMSRDLVMAQPRMGDTLQDAEWVASVMGIEVRMPAQWRYERDGKLHIV